VICITTKNQPTEPATKRQRWLSPTSINTYLRCPRKFYLRYIKKLKTKPNIHLLRGSAVHKALERYFREGYVDSSDYAYYDDTRRAILSLFSDEWRSRKDQLLALELKDQDLAFYYQDSQKMIINWFHDYLKSGEPGSQYSETEQKIFSAKWRTMCIIDRVSKARSPPLIIDYKTCKSAELKDEYKRQMGICALLYEDKYGVKPATAIHYLKFLGGLRSLNLSDKFMEDLKRLIMKIHDKTMPEKEDDYVCTCGGWCEKDFMPADKT
jgi:RecB family exonuclease